MKTFFLAILAILLIQGLVFAQCRGDQDGSVAIAGSIRNLETDDFNLDGGTTCVDRLKLTGTNDKDAREFCLKLADIERRKAEHIATEASRAARRPIFISRFGYGNNRSCGSDGGQSNEAREKQRADQAKEREERALAAATAREKRLDAAAEARSKRADVENQARSQRMLEAQRARDRRMKEAADAEAARQAEQDRRRRELEKEKGEKK